VYKDIAGNEPAEQSMARSVKDKKRDRTASENGSEHLTLGVKLMTLSNLMRRITALRFQRLFSLSLVDGWIVSHLGVAGPMSLDELAYRCGLAKSQMSRGVSSMVKRQYVSRQRNPDNHSAVILTLTPKGMRVFLDIRRRWPKYNELLTARLEASDVDVLRSILDDLIDNSRRNLVRERKRSGDRGEK
jgi:DNA-binding MarR family transcriptional regulator